jgi:chromosome segregation ATPase
VDNPPEDVYAFLQSWRATEKERAATELTRWSALLQSYHAARQTLTNQIAQLQQEAQQDFTELENSLSKRVQEAAIPEEKVEESLVELSELLRSLRERFEQPPDSLSEARALKPAIMNRRITLFNKIRELQERYQPKDAPAPVPVEIHMNWSNLLGTRRVNSPDDLKQIMKTLEQRIYVELEQQRTVIIE